MQHSRAAGALAALLLPALAVADAPLHKQWIEVAIARCDAQAFTARTKSSAHPASPGIFQTTVIAGTVVQSGHFPNPSTTSAPPLSGQSIGQPVTLSVPEAPPGFCSASLNTTRRFAYTYGCDTGVRAGRCSAPYPDAYLVPRGP